MVFALAKQELTSTRTCILIISPLKSIIDDQISEMLSLSFTALELSAEVIDVMRDDPPQFLYCSAEAVLEETISGSFNGKQRTPSSCVGDCC